jgi:hypothetical protein
LCKEIKTEYKRVCIEMCGACGNSLMILAKRGGKKILPTCHADNTLLRPTMLRAGEPYATLGGVGTEKNCTPPSATCCACGATPQKKRESLACPYLEAETAQHPGWQRSQSELNPPHYGPALIPLLSLYPLLPAWCVSRTYGLKKEPPPAVRRCEERRRLILATK